MVDPIEGIEAGLLVVQAARSLLEDWALDLKTRMIYEKHQRQRSWYHNKLIHTLPWHYIEPFISSDQLCDV